MIKDRETYTKIALNIYVCFPRMQMTYHHPSLIWNWVSWIHEMFESYHTGNTPLKESILDERF